MNPTYRILHLVDPKEAPEPVEALLDADFIPCGFTRVEGLRAFAAALREPANHDLILADHPLPGIPGEEVLEVARSQAPRVPLILLGAGGGDAAAWLRRGARDWVARDDLSRLPMAVRRALEESRLQEAHREALVANDRLGALTRTILDVTSEGVLVMDLAGRISAYNRKFLSLCGIPEYVMATMDADQVLRFLVDQFQDPGAFLEEIRRLGPHPSREGPGLLTTPAGRTLEAVSVPARAGSLDLGRVLGLREVTEREKPQEPPRPRSTGDARLLEAARSARVGLFHASPDELVLSGSAIELLGLPEDAPPLTLEGLEGLFHPEDLDLFRGALERPGGAWFEARVGARAWTWTAWSLSRAGTQRYHGVFVDITARLALQEELTERRRQEWVGSITSSIARSLRNPIERLTRNLAALGESPMADPGQTRQLEAAAQAAGALAGVLDQLENPPDPKGKGLLMDLNDLVDHILPWAEPALGRGIHLRLERAPQLPPLPQNPARLEPVLMNLLRNAGEALGGTGTVTVRTGVLQPREGSETRTGSVFLEVEDDGPGIPPKVLGRIFEPFYTTREKAKGLGLPVVRRIVNGFGGTVQVETEAGRGTRFRILLPAG